MLLNYISTRNIRGDAFGGLTAAVVALPMALAFGVASGAGAAAGLWGAVIIGLVAALFGGTSTLISEPTGPMTVVFTAVILNFTSQIPDRATALALAFMVVMLAGLFQILFGLCRLGRYITMMPYTVISGFMSGIGVILVILHGCTRSVLAKADSGVSGEKLAGVLSSSGPLYRLKVSPSAPRSGHYDQWRSVSMILTTH